MTDLEELDCEACAFQRWKDDHSPVLSGSTHATLSLLDIARYQMTEKRNKGTTNYPTHCRTSQRNRITARSGLGDFEVIRLAKVFPVPEEELELGDSSRLSEWEKLDALSFKRTYSEAAQGFVDGIDPPKTPGCSRVVRSGAEDDPWEYL